MKTVRKALRLLRLFRPETPELGVTDIARKLDIDPAGAHRLLRALLEERFVDQDPATRLYRLGLGILDVAAVRLGARGLLDVALPHLEDLRDRTGETTALLASDGVEAICLVAVESRQPVRVGYAVGERIPLHASASGQMLLAHMPDAERAALYAGGLRRYTPHTLVDPDVLEARLAEIRAAESAWAADSYMAGVVTGAAAVMDPKRMLAAVVAIAAPAQRWPTPRIAELADAARTTAVAIEREWAGLEPQRAAQRIA